MKTSTAVIVVVALIAVLGAGWWYFAGTKSAAPADTAAGPQPVATAAFACDAGRSISAAFFEGSVALSLSDGRTMALPQAVSGSGIRYANQDESFVFWGKGNTAFVEEGASQQETYSGCVMVAPDATGLLNQVYATSTAGFSLRFPAGYTAAPYTYQALGPGKNISGVKFTIPASSAQGTNLSKDSYISVEWLPGNSACLATSFLDGGKAITFSDSGVDYSAATSSGAGAGNLYDEAVFSIPGTNPCTAVRYYIHSTQLGNYPEGTVTAFDKAKLVTEFDFIRRSLVLGR